jgi:alpha-glucosidase (family GH31 glycosyl hydrolase)
MALLAWATASAQITLKSESASVHIDERGFRFSLDHDGQSAAAAHAQSGLVINDLPVLMAKPGRCSPSTCHFNVSTSKGDAAEVTVELTGYHVTVTVVPAAYPAKVLLRTAGIAPSYGVGDRASEDHRDNTDLTGLVDDHLLAGRRYTRLTSNFVIFPKQGMAEILPDPHVKLLHLTDSENAQGVMAASAPVVMHYFLGTPRQIYAEFLAMRNDDGYPVMMPKYEMFGVGWEAFGALGWDTNQKTVRESVDRYRSLGFPLSWAVIGSGFWPASEEFHETTSFGLIDKQRYSDMTGLLQHFHDEGLKVLFGLRITFITTGPYSAEGVKHGYFLKEDGHAKIFDLAWPKRPCYVLDAQNPAAVSWYLELVKKWKALGVDGFKEDMFGFSKYDLRDDKLDPINQKLMQQGYDLVERNGYITSDGDLHRIDDFNFDQDQDRGPVNSLALAYAGLPLIFPDIVGGTFGEGHFDTKVTPRMETYFMREAEWAALHSSMAVGQPPWSFKNPRVGEVMLQATRLHERLRPYIYSQAVRFVHEGYPWTMAPLPVAYPNEPVAYGRENKTDRGYEWMIGDALLATPLYGDDYETATARNIYLPQGIWIDYDSGEHFSGPTLLKNYAMPIGKTPLFVGGTGVLLEETSAGDILRIFPVKRDATTELWGRDAKAHSTITMDVKDWKKLTVIDTTSGAAVPTTQHGEATEFPFTAGHDYRIQ